MDVTLSKLIAAVGDEFVEVCAVQDTLVKAHRRSDGKTVLTLQITTDRLTPEAIAAAERISQWPIWLTTIIVDRDRLDAALKSLNEKGTQPAGAN